MTTLLTILTVLSTFLANLENKTMQSDFEPVFERKFHSWINCLEGVMHTGQRDQIRIRISKNAFKAGLRAKHFGEMLYAKIKGDYDTVVDRCQVTIYTDPAECTRLRKELEKAQKDLAGQNAKLANEKFVAHAPEAVIANERKKEADALSRIESLEKQLKALKG